MKGTFGLKARGVSVWDIIIWLAVIASIVTLVSRVLPVYTDHWTAVSVCEDVLADRTVDHSDFDALRERLVKQFKLNNLGYFMSEDRVLINQGWIKPEIRLMYEVRGDLFGNMDFVVAFDESLRN